MSKPSDILNQLQEAFKARGKTLTQVSEESGVAFSVVQRVLKRGIKNKLLVNLEAIAAALGTKPELIDVSKKKRSKKK